MVIIDTLINTFLGGLMTLDPAGMHCPSWDAFVSNVSLLVCPPAQSLKKLSTNFDGILQRS